MGGRFQGIGHGPLKVRLEQISDKFFRLEEGFEYVEGANTICVPKGLRTDLASIPKYLLFFEGRHGRHTLAALLHDYQVDGKSSLVERTQADDRFRRSLTELGVRPWRAHVMWAAVHLMSRFVSKSWVAKTASVLWLLVALCGYVVLLTLCLHRSPLLVALALVGPFIGAILWLFPSPSIERYKCGAVAGIALSVLGPFALVNLVVMAIAWLLDLCRKGSRPPFQWDQATECPAEECKCCRGGAGELTATG